MGDGVRIIYQDRVAAWARFAFGDAIARDKVRRNLRFFEEAIELVQAGGMTRNEAHAMVDVIFDRKAGHLPQEVGGVMTTLATLCFAHSVDLHHEAWSELERIEQPHILEKIRARQLDKFRPEPGDPPKGGFVCIDYTNYKGERGKRVIAPRYLQFGSTVYHQEKQWLLHAVDIEKGPRTFALRDIHSWTPVFPDPVK